MATFTLDTSGEVACPAVIEMTGEPDTIALSYRWSDLTPFAQGCVEALFREWALERIADRCEETGEEPHGDVEAYLKGRGIGFSDLSPEALGMILADCERWPRLFPGHPATANLGRLAWEDRQAGRGPEGFPPFTVSLGDDGKIYLRVAS